MINRSEGGGDLRKKRSRLFFLWITVPEASKENMAKICGFQ